MAGCAVTDFVTTPLFPSEFWVCSFFPHPTNATTAIIKRSCFMSLRLTIGHTQGNGESPKPSRTLTGRNDYFLGLL